MNILIINHYAGSPILGMEFRPYYLAREWIKLGHHVTIIAADFSHLRSTQPKVDFDLQSETTDGISYIWLKTVKYKSSNLKRGLNIISFTIKLLINRKNIIIATNPEIVIASSTYPLDIYPAYFIARKNKAKLVFELHDLWPLTPKIIGNYSKYNPFIWFLQKAENFSCRKSHCYISLLGNAKSYLIKHGLKSEKFFHVPNGFSKDDLDLMDMQIPKEHEELLIEIRAVYKIIIGYTGGITPSDGLITFIRASRYFTEKNDIAFILVGEGPYKSELIELVKASCYKNVYFLSRVSKSQIPRLLSKFDILYAGGFKSHLHSYGTSLNKIADYMLAGKPIIFALNEPNSIIAKVGCGFQISAENEAELVKTINYLSERSCEERITMGKKGRDYALEELNYTSLAKRFLDAIESC